MKRVLIFLLSALLLLGSFANAEEATEDGFDMSTLAEDYIIVVHPDQPTVAVCGLEKNADEQCYPASTTKILTCIIALETCNLTETVKIPSDADCDGVTGSEMGIHKKEVWTVEDLLYGMMLPSGNDAAIAIAHHISGGTKAFAELMNAKAAELGMNSSHFVNPNGLHHKNHYTTARDMAVLTAYAMQNEMFRTIVATKTYTATSKKGRTIVLQNTNRFLRQGSGSVVLYDEAIGVKTGDTPQAGKCLISAAQRGDTVYIVVALHCAYPPGAHANDDYYQMRRYKDSRALFDYVFEHDIQTLTVADLLARGLSDELALEPDAAQGILSATMAIDWNADDAFSAPRYRFPTALLGDVDPNEWLVTEYSDTPLAAGETVGTASVVVDGTVYFSAPILCSAVVTPTPSPSPSPTPTPTVTPVPTPPSTPLIEIVPAATDAPVFDWLSCAPKKVS